MALDKIQFQSLIERVLNKDLPTLNPSKIITNLLLGTAAQESKFGTYLRQLGGGPALGIFQMEKTTFDDLVYRFGNKFPLIKTFTFEQLEWDLRAAIIMARIKYYSCPNFPTNNEIQSLAAYWKQWYNTPLGAGKPSEFVVNYRKYVG